MSHKQRKIRTKPITVKTILSFWSRERSNYNYSVSNHNNISSQELYESIRIIKTLLAISPPLYLSFFFSPSSALVLSLLVCLSFQGVHRSACEASPTGSHGGNRPNDVWMTLITDKAKHSVILLFTRPGSCRGSCE